MTVYRVERKKQTASTEALSMREARLSLTDALSLPFGILYYNGGAFGKPRGTVK